MVAWRATSCASACHSWPLSGQTVRMPDHDAPAIPVIRWEQTVEGPVVVLLDQTRLPHEESEFVCADVPALASAIRELRVRGAPLLGIAGGYGVALAAVRGADVEEAAGLLAHARPTAVNLAHGVGRVLASYRETLCASGHGEGEAGRAAAAVALAEARALHREDAESSELMAAYGHALLRELLPQGGCRLLTHCNTGILVSGGLGTALAVVRAAHRAGELERLWVDETRPLLQGARLTAYEAAREGMPHSLLSDGAAGSLFVAGQVDAVLVGADRVAADGSVANKVGTYPLAVLARYHHVPFLVVAPRTTVDLDTASGADIVVEQRAAREVAEGVPGIPVAPWGTEVHNPAFDITPPELVTALVTEAGVVSPVTPQGIEEHCSSALGRTSRSSNGMMQQ